MATSTALAFLAFFEPTCSLWCAAPSAFLGGCGTALIILLWSEFFGCLPPLRVALCYPASIAFGALLYYLCIGFHALWLGAVSAALPIISLMCLKCSYRHIPQDNKPPIHSFNFSIPWKLIIFMAFYSFAFSLRGPLGPTHLLGVYSSIGTLVMAAILTVIPLFYQKRFDISLIYRIAVPLTVVSFVVLSSSLGSIGPILSNFCLSAGGTAFEFLVMLVCANMCYRYGVPAVWLFGLERGIRGFCGVAGAETFSLLEQLQGPSIELVAPILATIALVLGTLLFFSEKNIFGRWNIEFAQPKSSGGIVPDKLPQLFWNCLGVVRQFDLSRREEDVLLLLAQKKTTAQIGETLFISFDTAKSHIAHIYRKLDVHSRDELIEFVAEHSDGSDFRPFPPQQ